MDKKQIQNILDELYEMDGNLRDREKELISAINKISALKSDLAPDQKFRNELKDRLGKTSGSRVPAYQGTGIFSGLTTMSKSIYALGGTALVIALVVGYNTFAPGFNIGSGSKVSIDSTSERAFGDLSQIPGQAQEARGLGGTLNMSAMSADNAGSNPQAMNMAVAQGQIGIGAIGGSVGGSVGIDAKMIAPWPSVYYTYVYRGEPVEIKESKVNVLKKITGSALGNQFQSIISNLKFGGLNIKSFSNLYVQQLTVAEQRDYGYAISFNSYDGNVTIYENWERWTGAYPICTETDKPCPNFRELTQADMLSDSELIALAQNFVEEHGIDVSSYGAPQVVKNVNWGPAIMTREQTSSSGVVSIGIAQEVNPPSTQFYVPDVAQVVYPLLIEDKKVYDGHQLVGIYVNINIRVKKVSSVNNIGVNKYESSLYETEQDFSRIVKFAERGGYWGWNYDTGVTSERRELELGTPTLEYIRIWKYENNSQTELIVPALIFPVLNPPQDMYYYSQTSIAVPIVKDLLSKDEGNDWVPMPAPMIVQ